MAACGHGGAMKQLMIGRRVAMLSLFVLSACAGSTKPAEAPHALLGKAAPELSGGDVPGSPSASFSRDGTVVIVDFWATHCGPCVKAFPKLQALEQRHAGKVRVIGVSEDDELDVIAPFVARTGVKFSMLWDKDKATGERYGVKSMPETFVLDKKGTIRFVHLGYRAGESEAIEEEVSRLLAE